MAYFEKDFLDFFTELKSNNNKDWFDENRKRYKTSIKEPFENFVGEMIERISEHEPNLLVTAKDCILRINRDIRFSKDKTPYNTHVTAFISKGGRKDKSHPGFFIRLSSEMIGIMIGCFGPDKKQLHNIREAIATCEKDFISAITEKDFVKKFGTLQGDVAKRLPAEWKEPAVNQPLIAHKQFYFMCSLKPEIIVSKNLPEQLMEYYHAARPFNLFLEKALKNDL